MPFLRPALDTLVGRIQGDLQSRLMSPAPFNRRSFLGRLVRVLAGLAHGLYGAIDWVARQVLVDTAEAELVERHARIWGIARRAATPAQGLVTFTGGDGSAVPEGTRLLRGDGAEYTVTTGGIVAAGSVAVPVSAVVAGAAGNLDGGGSLTLVQPIAGLASTATAVAGLSAGADQEDDDTLRGRVIARIQEPPHGGAKADYLAWTYEVAGVGDVWIEPLGQGTGTVVVRVLMTGRRWPTEEELAVILAHLEEVRPVTAELFVVAPIARPIDMSIWVSPDTPEIRAAVTAELADLFTREGAPGVVIPKSHIDQAIANAEGEFDHTLTVTTALTAASGELMTLGTISWVVA